MQSNANRGSEKIIFGLDSVVIQKHISDIPGGRTLDVTGYPLTVVPAGSAVIVGKDENKNVVYKPMPIAEDGVDEKGEKKYKYGELPENFAFAGILYRSIATANPQASIMIDGVVNDVIAPFGVDAIKEAFTKAVPNIIFLHDEEA